MPHRFYFPDGFESDEVELTGAEAYHLRNVLRCQPGDHVELFDGAGRRAESEIVGLRKNGVRLRLQGVQSSEDSQPLRFVLATAVPKGERFRWLVEKATELGVDVLIPLETQRSVVQPGAGKLQKLRHTVIAACKQCGRDRLMQIHEPIGWTRFVAERSQDQFYIADGRGRSAGRELLGPQSEACPTVVAVGPEGGLTDEETDQARSCGARLISLGPHVLRIETAGVAIAALWRVRLDGGTWP